MELCANLLIYPVQTVNLGRSRGVTSADWRCRMRGDDAWLRWCLAHDGVDVESEDLYLDLNEIDAEDTFIDKRKAVICLRMIAFIILVCSQVKPQDPAIVAPPRILCASGEICPVDRVACYAPSGSFPLVSNPRFIISVLLLRLRGFVILPHHAS